MEGVMMKNKEEYAVAVRKPDNEIAVEKGIHKDFSDKVKLFKLPIFRGMLAFVDSLVIGFKVINYSASFFDDEDNSQTNKVQASSNKLDSKKSGANKSKKTEKKTNSDSKVDAEANDLSGSDIKAGSDHNESDKKDNPILMVCTVVLSLILSIGLFMALPAFIIELLRKVTSSHFLLSLVEGLLRLAIFIGYVLLVSLMKDIKRVFMYHGAEHKAINCIENGFELTVENVRWQSKQHKRCGTSFMLLVILISLLLFIIFPTTGLFWRVISRILLVPIIAGISYEFIRLAGRSSNPLVEIISKPGLWMQGLTTREPDDSMIEVAIKSVEAVFDWKAFLADKANNNENAENSKANSDASETAAALNKVKISNDTGKRNVNTAPVAVKNTAGSNLDDEDDEILIALDKYFDNGKQEENLEQHK